MSGFMPYVVEKGPYFSVIESLLADPSTRAQALIDLGNGKPIADMVGFDSLSLAPDGLDEAKRKDHLNKQWFGIGEPSFWMGYNGNPELILREAMIRAIEMSFGVEHGDPGPDPECAADGRHWPIDMYWICQGPWFQCWVLWRAIEDSDDDGHVTLLMTTPAAYGYPLTSKITRPVRVTDPPYTAGDYAHPPEDRSPPARTTLEKGMWVVGHEDYVRGTVYSTIKSCFGSITFPTMGWNPVDATKVECVVPAEREGGVLDVPRRYVAP